MKIHKFILFILILTLGFMGPILSPSLSYGKTQHKEKSKIKKKSTSTQTASRKPNKSSKRSAGAAKKTSSTTAAVKSTAKLEQRLSFNDRMVNGKHQVPGEGLVTVENEKPVFNLLSMRTDFKDRREKERQRD